MYKSIGYYEILFRVPVSESIPIVELWSAKVIYKKLGHGAVAWCSLITQASSLNDKTIYIPILDLYGANNTDIDCSLAMSDAIVKGKK